MRRSFIALVSVVVVAGCASLRFGRLESYQALPVTPDAFADAPVYTVIIFPKPVALIAEAGTAWRLLVQPTHRSVEKPTVVVAADDLAVAPATCGKTYGVLATVLLGDPVRYAGARGVLVAHDGQRCFTATGEALACATIPWDQLPPLSPLIIRRSGIRSEDVARDAAMLAWYATRLQQYPIAGALNSTLDPETWERIAGTESVWTAVEDAAIPAGVAGGAAGAFGTLPAGVVVGGLTFLAGFTNSLVKPPMGPEHGDRPVSAQEAVAFSVALHAHHLACEGTSGRPASVAAR